MSSNNSLVKIESISKWYRSVQALDNVSFDIHEGEVFGYIGPNGAGKTTTIKILVGLISEFSGKLSVGDFTMPGDRYELHKMLGYMPQDVAFQEWRTVNHALTTFGLLSGLEKSELNKRKERVLEIVGLSLERNKKIVHLSGGMTQKLGLAQALLHEPKLLVLDEPLSGLDPESRFYMKKIIKELSSAGITCFFSSHILSDVQDVATKIGIIDHGRILKIGSMEELKSHFSVTNDIRVVLSEDAGNWRNVKILKGVSDAYQDKAGQVLIHLKPGTNIDNAVHDIITSLIEHGCRVRSINPVEPSLDDVYLKFIREGRES